jgi:hypothetical protein
MRYYVPQDPSWTEASSPPDPPYLTVDAEAATLQFMGGPDASVRVAGAPVDPSADTIHTVSSVAPSFREGAPLCAIYVRGQDLDVEDRRSSDAPSSYADAVERLRSALEEILIPVYIDDAIEEMSETVDGLLVIHTVQHDDGRDASHTYFRTAVFQDGELLLETEDGTL